MTTSRSRGLRGALLVNALFSIACALGLWLWAPAAGHLGVPPLALHLLGGSLLAFASYLVWQAMRPKPDLLQALLTSIADMLWVVGSVVVLALRADALTVTGIALVVGVAACVGVFAVAQIRGLQHLVAEPDPNRGTRYRFAIEQDVAVRRDAMWRILADIGAIERYSTALSESFVRGEAAPGLGVVRECANTKGQRWSERCTSWQPGRSIELEFQTKEAGFPYPLDPMHGGWVLDAIDDQRTRVTVWWSFTTKPPWAGWLLVPLMSAGISRTFPSVIRAMADDARRLPGGSPTT